MGKRSVVRTQDIRPAGLFMCHSPGPPAREREESRAALPIHLVPRTPAQQLIGNDVDIGIRAPERTNN